jgi:hypothetical protein
VAVRVATGVPASLKPAYTSTRTCVESPGAVPPAPVNAGVESLVPAPFAGATSVTCGATVSTLKVTGALLPIRPSAPVTVT